MIDAKRGAASKTVQDRVLYAFWALVFTIAFLFVFAGYVFVWNMLQAGTVPNVGQYIGSLDSTQTMLAVGGAAYFIYVVTNVFLVATFGKADVEAGADVAQDVREAASGGGAGGDGDEDDDEGDTSE